MSFSEQVVKFFSQYCYNYSITSRPMMQGIDTERQMLVGSIFASEKHSCYEFAGTTFQKLYSSKTCIFLYLLAPIKFSCSYGSDVVARLILICYSDLRRSSVYFKTSILYLFNNCQSIHWQEWVSLSDTFEILQSILCGEVLLTMKYRKAG